MTLEILTLLPVVVCLILILIFKNPFIAIGISIVVGVVVFLIMKQEFILDDAILSVFKNESTLKTTGFILMVGGIIGGINKSGGVDGLVAFLERKKFNTNSKILTQLFVMLIGISLFIDGTSSMVVTAVVGKPLFKKNGLCEEKLALITNSTASPIAWIIPFGAAGALTASLLTATGLFGDNSFNEVIKAMPFQFYTISLLLILLLSILFRFDIGSIRKIKSNDEGSKIKIDHSKKARNMIVPILFLVSSILIMLFITGDGNILKGNSSDSIFYSGLLTFLVSFVLYKSQKFNTKEIFKWFFTGIKSMLLIVVLLLLAYVFSNVLHFLGTTTYIVQIFEYIPIASLPLVAFIIASVISFSTGTSGGTVSILVPLLVPIALTGNVNISIVIGAIISGSVFGDQNSIISDSVIMTSSVTGVKAIDHVKTQMPYTLIAFGVSSLLYVSYIFVK